MARPSKLSEKDRAEIRKRILDGEKIRQIAADYKMAESSIREGFSDEVRKIKDVANQIVTTEQNLAALPISAQLAVIDYASTLRSISSDLCIAAKTGANNAVRLHAMAALQLDKVTTPETPDMEVLRTVNAVTQTANLAAKLGVDLITANKGQEPQPEVKAPTLADFYKQG